LEYTGQGVWYVTISKGGIMKDEFYLLHNPENGRGYVFGSVDELIQTLLKWACIENGSIELARTRTADCIQVDKLIIDYDKIPDDVCDDIEKDHPFPTIEWGGECRIKYTDDGRANTIVMCDDPDKLENFVGDYAEQEFVAEYV
jgi:hypothetical protein